MATTSIVRNEDQFCVYRAVESQGTRVLWELTSACNLKCDFCLVEIKRRHLPLARALEIADDLIAVRVDKVLLSGGEPLLYPGIENVIRHLVAHDILVKLLTNGTVEHPAVFRLIRQSNSIEVSLSIPTVDADEADRIFVSKGALAKIAGTIEALPKARLNAICAVSQLNVGRVGEVIDWVADAGVPCISLTDIFKDPTSPGRFRDDCRDLRIGQDERRMLFDLIGRKRSQYRGRLAIRTTQFAVNNHDECLAGRSIFYVDSMGLVLPCTITDNRDWRNTASRMRVRNAIAFYRQAISGAPESSCSAHLASLPFQFGTSGH
ncbi:radical SAM protein [Bradyrhizobium murdochi]|uniref:radical SAM protein n=1 Tax=Bradyrhizobium murdochi TaxID=1038859 RepID=UPI0004875666|nr:radical SAM protein [Bradyrhizobium murdochi]